jgi:fimbrial isopeptide formation D2 family protein/LPXTG-motif cell wall-anchored protein
MKTTKKLLAILLAVVLVMALTVTAFATEPTEPAEEPAAGGTVTITVNRDETYESAPENGQEAATGDRDYTWYRVFTAAYESNSTTGEGPANADGTPYDLTVGDGAVAYTATSAVAAKLGSWDAEAKTWTKASGNLWFDLTPIAGTTNYSVTWANSSEAAATVQAAAAWLIAQSAYEETGSMTVSGTSWTADVVPGYYLIKGSEGANLVAATTDITINEKNAYPTIDKKQADEDNTTAADYIDDDINVAIGDVIDYTVIVHVPGDANQDIVVTDTMSAGLTYDADTGLTFSPTLTAGTDYVAGDSSAQGWAITIKPTDNTKNKDITITFKATVNDGALTDTTRSNVVELKYNGNHYVMSDEVTYTTYFTGIVTINGDEEPLEGVKFDLFEDGEAFNVTLADDGYYIPGGDDNEVVTDADGLIRIRGLDDDKTYTLTETETLPGYNMLAEDVTLELVEDVDDAFATATADEYQPVENNTGSVLPSTGGIGTTIFYILGTVLVLGAVVVLVAKKRVTE